MDDELKREEEAATQAIIERVARPWGFQKGHKPYPHKPRPKTAEVTSQLKRMLSANSAEKARKMAMALLRKATGGPVTCPHCNAELDPYGEGMSVAAAQLVIERTEGRLPLPVVGADDGPLEINVKVAVLGQVEVEQK